MKGLNWFKLILSVFVGIVLLIPQGGAFAADKENCLMCHKYRFLGRIDESGKRWNYNVDEKFFAMSVHRSIDCRECHTSIKKIPHDPVTEEVNCANQCHVKPPFSEEKFSHKKIIDAYNRSVHGIQKTDSPELQKAKPYCKYCHMNPLFEKVDEKIIAYDETLGRCQNCHLKQGVTQAYKHITHRLRHKTSRDPQEVVTLCAKCHQDKEMMKKLNVSKVAMTSVETYNRSIHGKSVMLGSKNSADCISCHASNLLHDIYKKDDSHATVHPDKIEKTCKQCHDGTNAQFVKIATHFSLDSDTRPALHLAGFGLHLALYGSVFGLLGLLVLETYGRRRDGLKWLLKKGTSWRGKPRS